MLVLKGYCISHVKRLYRVHVHIRQHVDIELQAQDVVEALIEEVVVLSHTDVSIIAPSKSQSTIHHGLPPAPTPAPAPALASSNSNSDFE